MNQTLTLLLRSVAFSCLMLLSTAMIAQNTVSGTVTDDKGEAVIAANVNIAGTTTGTTTDANGKFTLTSSRSFPWTLEVSYVGFSGQDILVESATADLKIALSEGVNLNEIAISASKRPEKIQEAPASISVINQKELRTTAQASPVRMLVNVPGVQLQQQSAGRINIEMRGAAGLFGTSVLPILDYRNLSAAGIGTFDGNVGNMIDLQRVEVVRGPGSALYGAGVTSGVVHFITKSPIDHPGITVQVAGGERNTLITSARVAHANEKKTFGVKVNATYERGDEWQLDGSEGTTSASGVFTSQLSKFRTSVVVPNVSNGIVDGTGGTTILTEADLDPDGNGNMMQDYYSSLNLNTTLEFRPDDQTTINVSGGLNMVDGVFYNSQGEGLNQQTDIWGQVRIQRGGLFAQILTAGSDGGNENKPTFLYQTGNMSTIGRRQTEGQVQYNFDVESMLNANFTVGVDLRSTASDSRNFVYGRNEDSDGYSLLGAYVQGKFKLADKVDMVLAGRYDQFMFLNKGAFAPRAAFVYKVDPKHTVRASYNRATAPNSALTLNIDFPLATVVPGAFGIWLRGNKETQTFGANPAYSFSLNGLPDGVIPVGTDVGLPLAVPFGATTAAVIAGIQALEDAGQLGAGTTALLSGILTDPTNTPTGSVGELGGGYNLFNGSSLGVIDAPQSEIRYEDTWEIGYKGLIGDKLGVTLDVYNITAKNFTLFTAISPVFPLINTSTLSADLGAEVQANIQPDIQAALEAGGMDPATAAATAAGLAGAVNGAYVAAGDGFIAAAGGLFPIWATVETEQMPDNGITNVAAGYRTFDRINYTGVDLGLNYYVNKEVSAFFNFSAVSANDFMVNVVGADGVAPLPYSLGIPLWKFRTGVLYTGENGINANLSFQYDPSFDADFGQYSGATDRKTLLDLGLGYEFDNGLSLGVAVTNALNTKYRAFPNMPQIGRRALLRATYQITGNK